MSFSSDIKEQLSQTALKCPNCAAAELAGLLRVAGKITEKSIKFTTENNAVADRTERMLSEGFGIENRALRRENSKACQFLIDDVYKTENILASIKSEDITPFSCCRASYARGAFLGGGSISDPQKSYHMEFCAKDKDEAVFLQEILQKDGFSSKVTYRKGSYVVYIKESELIADILSFIGAGSSALEIFTIQIEKEMRNSINRRVNCENANADKAARASGKHVVAIKRIKAAGKFGALPETLREIAELRIEYPEDSLKELGEKTDPPIGKSGVNHRLNRIVAIADEL